MTRMILNPHSGTRWRGMFVRAGTFYVSAIGYTVVGTKP
jgi:hypothetical protein